MEELFPLPPREPSILRKHLDRQVFSPTHARGPATEAEAAKKAQERAPVMRERALLALADAHDYGMTDFELSTALHCLRTTAGKRRGELRDQGPVERTEKRRLTDTATSGTVWKVTEDGLRVAQQLMEEAGS
jgi:hypothetical protein